MENELIVGMDRAQLLDAVEARFAEIDPHTPYFEFIKEEHQEFTEFPLHNDTKGVWYHLNLLNQLDQFVTCYYVDETPIEDCAKAQDEHYEACRVPLGYSTQVMLGCAYTDNALWEVIVDAHLKFLALELKSADMKSIYTWRELKLIDH